MAHTATPWELNNDEIPPLIYAERGGKDGEKCIAVLDGGFFAWPDVMEREANAEFIVRACNVHDELVTALKKARHVVAAAGGWTLRDEIDAALAKAELPAILKEQVSL